MTDNKTAPTGGANKVTPETAKVETSANDTAVEEAKARALDIPDEDEDLGPSNIGDPIGEPVQCIVKRKFLSERGETVKPGTTFYYQEREGHVWPDYLEPVSKAKASAVRKELAAYRAEKDELSRKKAEARDFFNSVR